MASTGLLTQRVWRILSGVEGGFLLLIGALLAAERPFERCETKLKPALWANVRWSIIVLLLSVPYYFYAETCFGSMGFRPLIEVKLHWLAWSVATGTIVSLFSMLWDDWSERFLRTIQLLVFLVLAALVVWSRTHLDLFWPWALSNRFLAGDGWNVVALGVEWVIATGVFCLGLLWSRRRTMKES